MRFQTELIPARLIRRYKRFLADCTLPDGQVVTAHVANPGKMTGLAEPEMRVWLEPNDNPKRKLRFTWRLVEPAQGCLVGVDTGLANAIVAEALAQGKIPAFADHRVQREVRYGEGNRVDFLLTAPDGSEHLLEVKSVTLCREPGLAEFPDTTTARGAKHMSALASEIHAGRRATVLYLIQRNDCIGFKIAADIDPAYADAAKHAHQAGVETLAFATDISPTAIQMADRAADVQPLA